MQDATFESEVSIVDILSEDTETGGAEVSDVREFRGKLYEDVKFKPLHTTKFEDVTLKGRWDMELTDDSEATFILGLVHRDSGDSIILTFPSPLERKRFAESIVCLGHVQQVTPGMNLEGLVRKPESAVKKRRVVGYALTATVAIGLAMLASKILGKSKHIALPKAA